MARAISSLPVPLSPVSMTVLLVGAHWAISRNTLCIGGLAPMMFSKRYFEPISLLRLRFSCNSRRRSSARCTTSLSSSGSNGLAR